MGNCFERPLKHIVFLTRKGFCVAGYGDNETMGSRPTVKLAVFVPKNGNLEVHGVSRGLIRSLRGEIAAQLFDPENLKIRAEFDPHTDADKYKL